MLLNEKIYIVVISKIALKLYATYMMIYLGQFHFKKNDQLLSQL